MTVDKRLAALLVVASALAGAPLGGCATQPETSDNERSYRDAVETKLARLRAQIADEGVTPRLAAAYANLARGVHRADVREGRTPDRAVTDQAIFYLHEAARAHPEEAVSLHFVAKTLYQQRGQPAEAAAELLAALTIEPEPLVFRELLEVERGEAVDATIVEACAAMRDDVPDRELIDFLLVCHDAAGGDFGRMQWMAASLDVGELQEHLAAHEPATHGELVRVARARVFTERRRQYTIAAVLGLGVCHVDNCVRGGWTGGALAGGDVQVRCGEAGCLRDGWEARLPGGEIAATTCAAAGDCLRAGWRMSLPDGSLAETRCDERGCVEHGWTTSLPDGESFRTSCRGGDCLQKGWETRVGDETLTCACVRKSCQNYGATCRVDASS